VADLEKLGVQDGERRHWWADDNQIETFKKTSALHAPPNQPEPADRSKVWKENKVEISVSSVLREGKPNRLTVTFRNDGPASIEIGGATLDWKYEPPRLVSPEGQKPSVHEAGGSISLRCESKQRCLAPGTSINYFLADDLADVIVAVLQPDVKDSDISVVVGTTTKLAWVASGDEVPIEVRKTAQSILASWGEKQGHH
jgi:hypothetical protein